ncbi:hypothetical protein D8Y22_08425 [Salinadaptatus halalkaliphilus]|uniref:ArsR family transcriptional regulator n=1 Tax=Salinadaptatus halalkaliphilus TaxID=2419781 RepID=A0A4S3TM13_9EURY|nr:hypothetical protein [Salinadaptatus halalkaliphilus]THE65229.1 hypothetical protein D8Y22_08425 [Salinadaptatus halalkaliphilus]
MGYDWGTQLFSSPHRLELLRELRSNPADTQALTDALSSSRVTIQRHLNRSSELGWVRKVDGRYELTPLGEHVCAATTAFVDRLSVLQTHEAVIDSLAAIDPSFDPLLLTDATVSVADSNNPHEPIIHYRRAMNETTTESIRGILPVFSELLVEVHRDMLADGVDTELIAPRSVLESAPEDAPHSSQFSLYVLDRPISFGLTLTDDAAFVGTYDDGTFVACIESSERTFREWASDIYDRYREQAVGVSLEAPVGENRSAQSGRDTVD